MNGLRLISLCALCVVANPVFAKDGLKRIIPDDQREIYETIHYAPAVVHGNDVYLSGISGQVYEGENAIERQFESAFRKLKRNLEAAGSDLSHVKEIYSYHIDLFKHAPAFLKARDRYFPNAPYAAWTSVEIDRLPPGAVLEIVARAERIEDGDRLRYLDAPGKKAAELRYTPAVVDGDMVYVSGLSGKSDGTTVEEQFRSAFETLKTELESAGSGLDDIIEMDTFHVDIDRHLSLFKRVFDEYVKRPVVWRPTGIKGMVDPKGLLEITVRARHGESEKRIETIKVREDNQAAVLRFGDVFYTAAVSADPRNAEQSDEKQFDGMFKEIGAVLAEAGLSFDDVVELNSYHTDMTNERFFKFVSVKDRYLKKPYPAWNGIGVNALPLPHARASVSVRALARETDDLSAIETAIRNYFDGVRRGNLSKLEEAFADSNIHMKYLGNEEGRDVIKAWRDKAVLDRLADNPDPSLKGRILSVNIYNRNAAFATFDFDGKFVDGFQLVKMNGRWRIVNKTYVDK